MRQVTTRNGCGAQLHLDSTPTNSAPDPTANTSAERNQKATEDATLDALAARPAADATTKRDQKATADADRRPRKVEEATPLTRKVRQAKRQAMRRS